MNLNRAWDYAVGFAAGTGVAHALFTYREPTAWLVLVGGVAMVCTICAGLWSDHKSRISSRPQK